jgi:putative ABC transport system substrate-binding protein
MPVVAFINGRSAQTSADNVAAFRKGLSQSGYVEGQNVAIEARWADNRYDQLPAMAAELVRTRVALIAAIGNSLPARAAKSATATIPIVFTMGADPVQLGLVASLNKPGENITGATSLSVDINQKRFNCFMIFFPIPKCLAISLIPTILPRHLLGAPPWNWPKTRPVSGESGSKSRTRGQ